MTALYIRLSCSDEDLSLRKQESYSIENQRRLLYDFLSEMPDLRDEEAREFVDDGFSGTNFDRPAFQKMLSLIKKRVVDTVIVKDFSRFGRNYVECADYLEKLFPFLGTRFISVSDGYDSGRREDSGIDIAMKNIVNSYYSRDLSRKVTSTLELKREKGEFFFGVPFGYLKDSEHMGKILIDESAAPIVRHIFSLAVAGLSSCGIAKRLNREGVPTIASYNRSHGIRGKAGSLEKSGVAAWTGTKVASVLKNEIYSGTYVAGKRRRVVAGSKKSIPLPFPTKIPDNHPAIVSREIFEEAQKIFKRRRTCGSRRFQLKSKVFCGSCGYAMTYRDNVRDECVFFCKHPVDTGLRTACPDELFSEELLNERVFLRLRQWMLFIKTAAGRAEEAEEHRLECLRLLEEESASLQSALEALSLQRLSLYESFAEGEISQDEFIFEKQPLTREAASIRNELSAVGERASCLRSLRNSQSQELGDLLESVRLFEKEPKLTCKMAEIFVRRVVIYDKWRIDIEWNGEEAVRNMLEKY